MKIFLATDHAGFELKEKIKDYLLTFKNQFEVIDFGAYKYIKDDDYPDFIHRAAKAVSESKGSDTAIIFGGSGQGEAIVANRYQHVRAGVINTENLELVKLLREHNSANILSFGARFVSKDFAIQAIDIFLNTEFSCEKRHARRLAKVSPGFEYKILPAILSKSYKDIKNKIALFDGFVDTVQIDVSDGILTPYKTFPYSKSFRAKRIFNFKGEIELHLMVQNNLGFLDRFGDLGASSMLVQIQSRDTEKALKSLNNKGSYRLGLSVMPSTSISAIDDLIRHIDYIQVMTIKDIGKQGSAFAEDSVELIRKIACKYPELPISVDGGVNDKNISILKEAGVRNFAVGSYIFKNEDPVDQYANLSKKLTD